MKLVAQVKLVPDAEAAILLDKTVTRINQACELVSEVALEFLTYAAASSQARRKIAISWQVGGSGSSLRK